jgi:D-psicose/D-tagatose/L-ribulose 3-epimerase
MIRLSYIMLPRLNTCSVEQLDRSLAVLSECGYAGVEFNLTEPPGISLDALERIAQRHNLSVVSFLTGEAYADGLCLCAPDADVRQRTVQRLVGYLETAQRFNAVLVVGLLQGQLRDEPDATRAHQRIADGLRAVADAATRHGVDLVVEPVNHLQVGFNHSVAEVLALIETVGSPALRPMIDTIHLNIEERSLTEPIFACGSALRHVHLCENNGARFGTGHIDFAAVRGALETIGYDGFASVKVYRKLSFEDAARSSIDVLRRAGF